jgi:hypothetical protein
VTTQCPKEKGKKGDDTMSKRKRTKGQRFTKRYTKNKISGNTNPTKIQG